MVTILSNPELDQDPERALRATKDGPVLVTDNGQPEYVLLSIEAYRALVGEAPDAA